MNIIRKLNTDAARTFKSLLLILILNSLSVFKALCRSSIRSQIIPLLNDCDLFPYFFVLVFGSWRELVDLKVYGSTVLLRKSHRKEGFPSVNLKHTFSPI